MIKKLYKGVQIKYKIVIILCCNLALSAQQLPQNNSQLFAETMGTVDKVNQGQNYTNSYNGESSASLPLGIIKQIGQTTYIIAVDSAQFFPNYAKCSAYMAIGLPGMLDTIAFAAKNIAINPKGVLGGSIGNSKLLLVSDHRIRISPKVTMILKNDGSNYVEWNCNGFQAINIKGYFEFSKTILVPENANGADTTVTASFEVHTNDIHNLVMVASVTPFKIKGVNDLTFSITEAVADFSELANAPNMVFPSGYQFSEPNTLMWTGFYLKNGTIKLPQELSNKNQPRTTIQANNLIIDNTGVTGNFSATNVLSVGNSDMGGWKFSVTQLGIGILQNHLVSGTLAGNLMLPIFDGNGLNYTANVFENPTTKTIDYTFIASPQSDINCNVLSASIDIDNTSQLQISKTGGKLLPKAILNGEIKFNSKKINTAKLQFQGVKIEDHAPYLTEGIFNYPKAINFPITINQIQLVLNQNNPNVYFNVGLNFMSSSDQGFSAAVGIRVKTKFVNDPDDTANQKIQFDNIAIENITINSTTTVYSLNGTITFMEDHPTYGDALGGNLSLSIPSANFSASFSALFGALPTYKYFYIDGKVIFPSAVPLTANIQMKGVLGGLYYHMSKNVDYVGAMQNVTTGPVGVYVPDESKGIGFKAGVTICHLVEETFNADMVLEMAFNSQQNGGGLAYIQFNGDAFCMINIANRQGKRYNQVPVGASGCISYDFNNDILHATLNVGVNIPSQISANISCAAHFEPGMWYVAIGKPSQKGVVSVAGFGTIYGYFMIGSQIDSPVMPPNLAQHFGNPFNRDGNQLSSGSGFCMGAELNRSVGDEYGFSFFTVYGYINYGIGFDVMMTKLSPSYTCPNTGTSPGFKGYYVKGSVYAYLSGAVGVKGKIDVWGIEKDFDFEILSVSAYAMLYGEFVRPTYVEGAVAASYNILGIVNGNLSFNFKTGTKCDG
jgi:hypothetical protein